METVLDPVSSGPTETREHPLGQPPRSRSEPTQSVAVPVQPGNAPIAQFVGSNNVSTTVPAGSAAAIAIAKPREGAERLAGAMSSFRPGGAKGGIGAHIGYSPYCVPTSLGEVKCVVVSEALKKIEPMAWDFVMNFARDNDLVVVDACLLPA
jgi:hypothetical protein